jgi:hypothetical protein
MNPCEVGIVRLNCSGYWSVTIADDKATAAAIIAAINCALGVTPPQREAMAAGSMFGFDCPAADPDSYTAAGNLKKPAA